MRFMALVVSASIVCASLCGISQWDQYLGNPGRTAYCDGEIDSPEILWSDYLGHVLGTPFIVGDKVVVLWKTESSNPIYFEPESGVALIDLLTGNILDEQVADVKSLQCLSPAGDLLLGITAGGFLYRINLETGEAPFDIRVPGGSTTLFFPIVLPDRVIFPMNPVTCFSRDDFSVLWDLRSSLGSLYPENCKTRHIVSSPGRIHAILWEEAGTKIWTVSSLTGEFLWVSDTLEVYALAAEGSTLYAGGENLYALDTETGRIKWKYETNVSSNILVGPDAVYFTDNATLCALDKTTGTLKWEAQREEISYYYPPLYVKTYVVGIGDTVVCSDVLNLDAFSAHDGKKLWNMHFQDAVDRKWKKPCPAVADGILVVIGKDPQACIIAFASDPELFVRQGEAFISMGSKGQAVDSYQKAITLYEKKGNIQKAEEIKKRISELGISPTLIDYISFCLSPESPPPPSTASPSPSASPKPTPSSSSSSPGPLKPIQESGILIAITGAVILVLIMIYYFKRKGKS